MPEIVLATLNAKYIHAAFGLRYLMANLGDLQPRATIAEFDINQRPLDIVESILSLDPKIVGFGVYIWNAELTLKIVHDLKRLRPDLTIVVGGPEVSYETEQQEIVAVADYVIRGEADLAFADFCRSFLAGRRPLMRVIDAALPEFEAKASAAQALALPYDLYDDADIAHRVLYVEASRGCPFKCEFCLSSLDVPVRNAPLGPFLESLQKLLNRGARQFKFVDRTFNLNLKISLPILQFFLDRMRPGLFVHFELIPDRLPEPLRAVIAQFPAGTLQFEVGVQTLNTDVESLISRRQDQAKLEENLHWLRDHTGVHVHADLIVGLPGEDLASFARGFDRLLALGPQEIQIGMLKRLRGTPICRHDAEWGMIYSQHPPYEILQTRLVPFDAMQRMRRFSRYWDLIANSGRFTRALPLLLGQPEAARGLAFGRFAEFADHLYAAVGRRTHGINLHDLTEHLRWYLHQSHDNGVVDEAIKQDQSPRHAKAAAPKRQTMHLQHGPMQ
ncbi:MAG TPA: DUF4080 domain-containing protein [Tepidisphaeraceae bacterium]|jgi:radical SAM superfamily enzyme YgiQ (UPF0313 family)